VAQVVEPRSGRQSRRPCWRWGQPIAPGQPWDLGPDDHDRNAHHGPEQATCNRATTGRDPNRGAD
jgi:hypothetical protein